MYRCAESRSYSASNGCSITETLSSSLWPIAHNTIAAVRTVMLLGLDIHFEIWAGFSPMRSASCFWVNPWVRSSSRNRLRARAKILRTADSPASASSSGMLSSISMLVVVPRTRRRIHPDPDSPEQLKVGYILCPF